MGRPERIALSLLKKGGASGRAVGVMGRCADEGESEALQMAEGHHDVLAS
jgi:hypothetical protein